MRTKKVNSIPSKRLRPLNLTPFLDNEFVEVFQDEGKSSKSLPRKLVRQIKNAKRDKRLHVALKVCTRTIEGILHVYVWNQDYKGGSQ